MKSSLARRILALLAVLAIVLLAMAPVFTMLAPTAGVSPQNSNTVENANEVPSP